MNNDNKKKKSFFLSVSAITLSILTVVNLLAFLVLDETLTRAFGTRGDKVYDYATNQYYAPSCISAKEASDQSVELCKQIEREGSVLLKNEENALPLTQGSRVSCFSQSSVDIIYGPLGETDVEEKTPTLQDALSRVDIIANPVLTDFYKTAFYHRKVGGLSGGVSPDEPNEWQINEIPYGRYTKEVLDSYRLYNDAAIVVISRSGAENGDLPRSMSAWSKGRNTGSMLELDADEKDLLQNVRANFDQVIVLLNTSNAMECGFLDEYNVDACIWIGFPSQFGLYAVADILSGASNPSGKLVDTYAYDAFSSPAIQNFGNFSYLQGGKVASGFSPTSGNPIRHHYVTYSEGIYVGYKYYETRFEDAVLGRNNAGNFEYAEEVQFPFGYGLSYTEFSWSDFKADFDSKRIKADVTVTNTGKIAGKDVVQLYCQAPYTAYDRSNKIEKAAVNLVAFAKTQVLEPGQSETLNLEFDVEDMKSYDAFGLGTYLLEEGDYYVTAASDAHQAICNVLHAKECDVTGDTDFVKIINLHKKVYNTDTYSGSSVGNLFGDCAGDKYHSQIGYLTRQNWSSMAGDGLRFGKLCGKNGDGESYGTAITPELKPDLEKMGYEASGAPVLTDAEMPVSGIDHGMTTVEMKGLPYDNALWGKLLDQSTVPDMTKMIRESCGHVFEMPSVGKPYTTDYDGPSAWMTKIGDGLYSGATPCEVVVASTWNEKLAKKTGESRGELALWSKTLNCTENLTGWYGPAMNIHRTPFSGRNFEYYSEDGTLSGIIGAATVEGATEKGIVCYIKHFAFNDQETNRMMCNVVWSREQALREVYLKPFEKSVKEGGAMGVMTAYNRIGTTWTGGSYALIGGVLRNEWGFNGIVMTDGMDHAINGVPWENYENIDQMLAAGGDIALNWIDDKAFTTDTVTARTYMRRAAKHCLYAYSNSNAMNGIDGAKIYEFGQPIYFTALWLIDGVCLAVLAGTLVFVFMRRHRAKTSHKKL